MKHVPVAFVTASDSHGAFAAQLMVQRLAGAGELGSALNVPRLIAHLKPGWSQYYPLTECVVSEYLPGMGEEPIGTAHVSRVLNGLCDLYLATQERIALADDLPEPVRPEPGALQRLLWFGPDSAGELEDAYGSASYRRLQGVAAHESDLLESLRSQKFALIHGDLWHRNVSFTPDGITLVDWEHAHFGNPGADLAQLWLMSPNLLAAVASGYDAIDELATRLRRRLRAGASLSRQAEVWRRGFRAHLLLEGSRTLWGPLRRSLHSPRATLTGERTFTAKRSAAERICAALCELSPPSASPL